MTADTPMNTLADIVVKAGEGDVPSQVAAQYFAVAHMARALAAVHEQIAPIIAEGIHPDLNDMRGQDSAAIMETLGNILNNMDAVDGDEDDWLKPVFANAHRLWPLPPDPLATLVLEAREALRTSAEAIDEMFRYYDGGETRGSYDGKPERTQLRKAGYSARATLAKLESL